MRQFPGCCRKGATSMIESVSVSPELEDLVDLAPGSQIDMRPTLLRVLTDLYLQRSTHTAEDERYYTELVLRLLDIADLPARVALAERLARYPSAPHAVIARLARDEFEVAAPILACSTCLSNSELAVIARERGARHADTIARRNSATGPQPKPGTPDLRAMATEAFELS